MAESVQVAAFEGGQLRLLSADDASGEVVLALPLSRLLVKVVRVPAENREDPAAFSLPLLQAMSPYPDEPLTVSYEVVRESADGLVVIAAALPESPADDVAAALDERKLNVTRVDALVLGQLRGLWGQVGASDGLRKLLLLAGPDCVSLVVIDGDSPSAIRAVSPGDNFRRDVMMSLLDAEDFGGVKPLAEIVAVGDVQADALGSFAPVRRLEIGEDAGLVGVAERSLAPSSLNALPESWREVLAEERFKAKFRRNLIVAGSVWMLFVAVLVGVPFVYDFLADRQKGLCKEHARVYDTVRETRDKVKLVQKYSDHARGALEIMKAVSDRLPQGVELKSWTFRREDGVKVSGEADDASAVYEFKDKMSDVAGEAEDGEEPELVFKQVLLNGPSAASGGKQKFDLDCRFEAEESE